MNKTDKVTGKSGFHRFHVENLELTVVTDGSIVFDPKQPILAPGVREEEVNEVLRNSFLPTDHVTISMNVLVIRSHDRVVLIDTGAGHNMGDGSGWLMGNLAIAGINPEDVTDVVLTHAHSDHIGGVVREDGTLSFPNADVYMTKTEHDFWTGGTVDFSKSKLSDQKWFIDFSLDIIEKAKKALGERLRLVESDAALFGFLNLIPAPGHTPGHVAMQIVSEGEMLFHLGDVVHTHVILFEHPEWGFEADSDFEQGVATRQSLLNTLTDSRQRIFSFHLPWPGLGHVRRAGKSFEWVGESFTGFSAN
jgi:glyoxylase-like metal-dependent hydrolase (beta-lactamase superfamily II)